MLSSKDRQKEQKPTKKQAGFGLPRKPYKDWCQNVPNSGFEIYGAL